MKSLLSNPRVLSLAIATLLLACGLAQLAWGASSVPATVALTLRGLFGYDELLAARLTVGIEFACAAAVLCVGRRFFALVIAASIAFVSLAGVSRGLRDGGFAWPLLVLVLSVVLLDRAARSQPQTQARRGLSPAWSAVLALIALSVVGRFASQLTFAASAPTAHNSHDGHDHSHGEHGGDSPTAATTPTQGASATPPSTLITIDLDMHTLDGRPLKDTPLLGYLPMLADLVTNEPTFLVFYNPECETCHTLFREHFALPRRELVIAVEIPPAPSMKVNASGDEGPLPIECLGCTHLSLPVGPNWLIAPPTVLKIENGVITCVADRFKGNCFEGE